MAYSRWSNSRWYTFYDESNSGLIKNEQCFTVMDLDLDVSFTYKEINESVDKCLNIVSEKIKSIK